MKPDHLCVKHPTKEAVSSCHHCQEWFCFDCLKEGPQNYYCQKADCIQALKSEVAITQNKCPFCGEKINPEAPQCQFCGKKLRELTLEENAEDLITIARFNNPMEAHLAKTKLESEGIEAYIADEHMVSINPGLDIAFGGVKLQVKKSDFDKAVSALD